MFVYGKKNIYIREDSRFKFTENAPKKKKKDERFFSSAGSLVAFHFEYEHYVQT